uniref:Uncharacterized protein n=1 Tax=Anopheles albimanus TaxID=7167 RepID=A0A182F728_ANOAL
MAIESIQNQTSRIVFGEKLFNTILGSVMKRRKMKMEILSVATLVSRSDHHHHRTVAARASEFCKFIQLFHENLGPPGPGCKSVLARVCLPKCT